MSLSEAEKMKSRTPQGMGTEELKREAAKLSCVVILHTQWYPEVMEPMLESAKEYLFSLGVPTKAVHVHPVPGSYELPLAAKSAIESLKPDFVVALGCVIKGETPHFDFVCSAVSQGIMDVQLGTTTPVGFGVLTVHHLKEALSRKDKGFEAAQAAFFMHLLQNKFRV